MNLFGMKWREKDLFLHGSPKLLDIHPEKEPAYILQLYIKDDMTLLYVDAGGHYFAETVLEDKFRGRGCFSGETPAQGQKKLAEKALIQAKFYALYYDQKWLGKHPHHQQSYEKMHRNIESIETAFIQNFNFEEARALQDLVQQRLQKQIQQNFGIKPGKVIRPVVETPIFIPEALQHNVA